MSTQDDRRGEHLSNLGADRLTDGEWRILVTYRLNQLESKVSSFSRALWANVAAIAVGIIVYLLTTNLGGH